jgi:predicted nucleic acid-binding protein
MTKIFWDTNLFIYLFQDDPKFGARVASLRKKSLERGDELYTSALAVGEVLAGVYRDKTPADADRVRAGMMQSVRILPFDERSMDMFGQIRAKQRTSAADTIHLACASVAEIDLFLTNDRDLPKLHISGIKFIAGLDTNLL